MGKWPTRSGSVKNGIKIVYRKKIEGGAGKDGRIGTTTTKKIVPIPKKAFEVRITKS